MIVEARIREAPGDASAHFYLSQIRNAFGDRSSPLALAEEAVALDGNVARYHRQVAEVMGVMAQHSNAVQQLFQARRFRKELDTTLRLDPRDVQALRDLMEFYLLAPGVLGGDPHKAETTAQRILAIDEAEGYLARARIAAFEHRVDDEGALLRKAANARPGSYRALVAVAQFYATPPHADLAIAEKASKDALALARGRAEAWAALATVYATQSRWTDLDSLLEEAARTVPDDLIAYYRAAERIPDAERAARYLRIYAAQEPEGNEPTAADARRELKKLRPTQ